jgi:hypothetical protein
MNNSINLTDAVWVVGRPTLRDKIQFYDMIDITREPIK